MSYIDRKRRRNQAENARLRAAYPDQWWTPPNFVALFLVALTRNPHEPRVELGWQWLPAFEEWLADNGWYRSGLGPNQWGNGFNVMARRLRKDADA